VSLHPGAGARKPAKKTEPSAVRKTEGVELEKNGVNHRPCKKAQKKKIHGRGVVGNSKKGTTKKCPRRDANQKVQRQEGNRNNHKKHT